MKRDEAELEAATTEMALCNRETETEAVNEGAKEAEKDVYTHRPQGRSQWP